MNEGNFNYLFIDLSTYSLVFILISSFSHQFFLIFFFPYFYFQISLFPFTFLIFIYFSSLPSFSSFFLRFRSQSLVWYHLLVSFLSFLSFKTFLVFVFTCLSFSHHFHSLPQFLVFHHHLLHFVYFSFWFCLFALLIITFTHMFPVLSMFPNHSPFDSVCLHF